MIWQESSSFLDFSLNVMNFPCVYVWPSLDQVWHCFLMFKQVARSCVCAGCVCAISDISPFYFSWMFMQLFIMNFLVFWRSDTNNSKLPFLVLLSKLLYHLRTILVSPFKNVEENILNLNHHSFFWLFCFVIAFI